MTFKKSKRILVVDDEAHITTLLNLLLENLRSTKARGLAYRSR